VSAELLEEKRKSAKLQQELKKYQAENERIIADLKQCKNKLGNRETEFSRVNAEYCAMLEEMQTGHE
jgi:septal ring factor EnvC (AmiA/AmiB activator)